MVRAIRILCGLAALATLVIMVIVGEFSKVHEVALFVLFAVFVNVPYILGWLLAPRLGRDGLAAFLFGVVVAGSAAFCLYLYWWTFFAERQTDAQDALVFVALPVYQSGAILVAFILAKVIAKLRG